MVWPIISANTCGALLLHEYGVANYLCQHLLISLTLSIWCGKLSLPTPVELSYLVNMVWQIISTNTCGALLPCQYGVQIISTNTCGALLPCQYGVANYLCQHLWSSLALSILCGILSLPTPVELPYVVNIVWQIISTNT